MYGVSIGCVFASKAIIEHSQVTDNEYWGGWVTDVRYYEDWNEKVSCTHPKYCTRTVMRDGKSHTQRYQCGYQHAYDVAYHSEYWNLRGSNGESINIKESQYNKLVKQFGVKPSFVDLKRRYHTNDGDMYKAPWGGQIEKLEAVVTKHSYENRVRVSSSSFAMEEPPEEIFEEYDLFHYPKIYDRYKQQAILGYSDSKAEKLFQDINALYGHKYEFKTFVTVFKNQPREAGLYQEQQWQGGNKNELNIAIGIDDVGQVKWCHVFSWTEEPQITVDTRNFVTAQTKLNLVDIANFLHERVPEQWVRKHFSEFSYLTVEPRTHHIVIAFIITFLVNFGIAVFNVKNEIDN